MTKSVATIPPAPDGLTFEERRMLTSLAAGATVAQACADEGITQGKFNRMLRKDVFRAEFDDLFNSNDLENIKRTLGLAASQAAETYTDTMTNAVSTKWVDAECPDCHHEFKMPIKVEDYKAKLHAADQILKINNILVDRRQIKTDINVTVQRQPLAWHEEVALVAYRSGHAIPPSTRQSIENKGWAEELKVLANAIEGEFKEVTE